MTRKEKLRTAGILRDAHKIMKNKARWCQGAWGKGKDNKAIGGEQEDTWVQANSPQAVKWCVEGAIMKVAWRRKSAWEAIRHLDRHIGETDGATTELEYADRAQTLNDSDGDASRKALCGYMLETAKELESG